MAPLEELTPGILIEKCGVCRKKAENMLKLIRKHNNKSEEEQVYWRHFSKWSGLDYYDVLFLALCSKEDIIKLHRNREETGAEIISFESKYGGSARLPIPAKEEKEQDNQLNELELTQDGIKQTPKKQVKKKKKK